MILESKFNIGDIVWCIVGTPNGGNAVEGPYSIGMVQIEIVDSPGMPGEELFNNYKSQKKRKENYMFVETGIGSGKVYDVKQIHLTEEDAFEDMDKIDIGKL